MRRAAALVVILAEGCFDPSFSDTTRCGPSGACPAGRQCVNMLCVTQAPTDGGGGVRNVLILQKAGAATGTGTITVKDRGESCDASCSSTEVTFSPGGVAMIVALPSPGSHFQGWTGACSGAARKCSVTVDGTLTATARFTRTDDNLMFVTSQTKKGTFGTLDAADVACAEAAASAGIGDHTWVALLSSPAKDVRDRLVREGNGRARGWRRLDGLPIADTIEDLFDDRKVFYPVLYDENGEVHSGPVWSGSQIDGTVTPSSHCAGWTGGTDPDSTFGAVGRAALGPNFLSSSSSRCSLPASFFCAMVDRSTSVLKPPAQGGKLIYITDEAIFGYSGWTMAQSQCDAEKPQGRTVHPLVAQQNNAASRFIVSGATYVRPDGIRVGTGADLLQNHLETGIWVSPALLYSEYLHVWTGSSAFTTAENTTMQSCIDWSDGTKSAVVGSPSVDPIAWWNVGSPAFCNVPEPVYCVEE